MKIYLILLLVIIILIFLNMVKKISFPKFYNSQPNLITKEKLRFLDNFYIHNRFYTFSMIIFYLSSYCLPILFLRFLSLGQTTIINYQSNLILNIFEILIQLCIFIIIWVLYTNLIYKIAAIEINKFFLLLISTNKIADLIFYIAQLKPIKYLIVFIRVFAFRCSSLSLRENMYPIEFGSTFIKDNEEYDLFYLDGETYTMGNYFEYKYFKKLINITMNIVRKNLNFGKFLYKISRIMYFLYRHYDNFVKKLPLFIFLVIFIFEIYNKQIYFTYFLGLWIYILNLKKQFYIYFRERHTIYDRSLGRYFYSNSISYLSQRENFIIEGSLEKLKIFDSRQNAQLYHVLERIIEYASVWEFNEEEHKKIKASHIRYINELKTEEKSYTRFFLLIFLIFCFLFSFKVLEISNITIISLFIILSYMIYLQAYIYYMKPNNAKPFTTDRDLGIEDFIYNERNNKIFWFFAIILTSFFFYILLRPQLIFVNSEIIFNFPPFIITKVYSSQEKMLYLFQIFEFYLTPLSNDILDKDYLRYLLRITIQNEILDSNLTLRDIQIFMKLFIENYFFNEISQKSLVLFVLVQEDMPFWLKPIKGIIIIGAIICTLAYYYDFFKLVFFMQTLKGQMDICKQIMLMILKNSKKTNTEVPEDKHFIPFKYILMFIKYIKEIFF